MSLSSESDTRAVAALGIFSTVAIGTALVLAMFVWPDSVMAGLLGVILGFRVLEHVQELRRA